MKVQRYCNACEKPLYPTQLDYCARHKTMSGEIVAVSDNSSFYNKRTLYWSESDHPLACDTKPYFKLYVEGSGSALPRGISGPVFLDVQHALLLQVALSDWLLKATTVDTE